jgi:hypothetical protein
VRFFTTSKLPVEALKSVWTVADQPVTNTLDRPKFAVAIRLIQLLQNGTKGQGSNLQAPAGFNLRPAHFEGVSGVSVPLPVSTTGPTLLQQQQQQQPSIQQQPQQTMRPPSATQLQTAPPRPIHNVAPGLHSTALTAQDPYTMTPPEQSRYESLFPEYAQPDGFCYGAQAVALFSKSGVAQPQLASIWNLVDVPVDNRLDKLEFALAMHLIVCVSKKKLPLPPQLPTSLQQLKSQHVVAPPAISSQSQTTGNTMPPHATTSSMQPPPPLTKVMSMPNRGSMQTPPPPLTMSVSSNNMQPPPPALAMSMSSNNMQPPNMMYDRSSSANTPVTMQQATPSGLAGPPPITLNSGGMDISDAFAGLHASSDQNRISMTTPTMNEVRAATPPTMTPPLTAKMSPPKTSEQLKQSYSMGASSEELEKIKVILQKLQAENISLKAGLTHLTEEEKDVQKETMAVVSEIGSLSNQLTTLRAKVLAAKSRLMEASAELKAAREKKG